MTPSFTRREFLVAGAALPSALRALASADPPEAAPRWVFLGTDAGAGLYWCAWDAAAGRLGEPELAAKADQPGFLALHPRLPRLYSANAASGAVSCFEIDKLRGSLRLINQQPSRGEGPCFVSIDATGRSAFVANYSGGSLAAFGLTVDGLLLPPTGTLQCKGVAACGRPGPVHDRQDGAHFHSATISPGNDFVLACDLGDDAIEVVAIRPGADNPLGAAFRVAARPGSGPRHMAIHPNGRWVYVIHELDCTIERFDWSVIAGRASLLRQEGTAISTLPLDAKREGNTACEIIMGANGRFLYACTRGDDMLTVYRLDRDGSLHTQQRIACGGKTPRHIAFDPTRRFLLCANQAAPGSVTVFAHNAESGELTGPVQTVAANTPMFVQFV